MSAAADYPAGNAQRDLKLSSAAWVAQDVLLLLELNDVAGIGGVRLVVADLAHRIQLPRTALRRHPRPGGREQGSRLLGLTAATTTVVYQQFETDPVKLLPSGKLEGLSILNANQVAISNDNDFGIGDVPGTPSGLTILRLGQPLPGQ
jgi:hypothetical protein